MWNLTDLGKEEERVVDYEKTRYLLIESIRRSLTHSLVLCHRAELTYLMHGAFLTRSKDS